MTFYGFEIPKDRKEIIQKLKRTRAGKCVECCKECPINLGGKCLACNEDIVNKYPHLCGYSSSTIRDILYKEYINLKQIVQEELEI